MYRKTLELTNKTKFVTVEMLQKKVEDRYYSALEKEFMPEKIIQRKRDAIQKKKDS